MSGGGTAIVCAVGMNTAIGKLGKDNKLVIDG